MPVLMGETPVGDPLASENEMIPEDKTWQQDKVRKKRQRRIFPRKPKPKPTVKTRRMSDVRVDRLTFTDYLFLSITGFEFIPIGVLLAWMHDAVTYLMDSVVYWPKEKSWTFYVTPFLSGIIDTIDISYLMQSCRYALS